MCMIVFVNLLVMYDVLVLVYCIDVQDKMPSSGAKRVKYDWFNLMLYFKVSRGQKKKKKIDVLNIFNVGQVKWHKR